MEIIYNEVNNLISIGNQSQRLPVSESSENNFTALHQHRKRTRTYSNHAVFVLEVFVIIVTVTNGNSYVAEKAVVYNLQHVMTGTNGNIY